MDTKEKLQNIFREVFGDSTLVIFDEMTANDVEEWDSLTHIGLILEIEKEFGIKLTTKEISSTKNVGEFLALIEKRQERRSAPERMKAHEN